MMKGKTLGPCWIPAYDLQGCGIRIRDAGRGMALSIEIGGVFGYDEVPQRAGTRSMDSKGKCQVMLSEAKLSEASALIVDEIPNQQANKPFSPSLRRNSADGKTYLNERKGPC